MGSYDDAVKELMEKAAVDETEAHRLMEEAIQRAARERGSWVRVDRPATDEDKEPLAG